MSVQPGTGADALRWLKEGKRVRCVSHEAHPAFLHCVVGAIYQVDAASVYYPNQLKTAMPDGRSPGLGYTLRLFEHVVTVLPHVFEVVE
jgi:hypothetical protein